ncbi:hypothetical protein ATI61_118194 [Archangium gephyra]|uniref:Uncharacterized protein n=2 Tax=Archangium gephyra TaxID=48 RepID=A0AAC8TEM8_9BACT|nr:Hypothetical protein AA314_04759 [Archangium gephyra]REG22989.1 hypothetical protein ATI61_118194 [Archangium gephyra]
MPRVSQTNNPRVMSAARAAPLPKEQQQGPLSQKLKAESANVALNALSIVKEKVEEFREQDSFFKYKAFIVAGWVFLSISTFGITCARGSVKQTGDFGAKLVPVPAGRAGVTIMNKSEDAWEKVRIIVKDNRGVEFNAFVPRVEAGYDVTITPKQLLNANGQAAPSDIKIVGVEMQTAEGDAVLLENGKNLTDAQ